MRKGYLIVEHRNSSAFLKQKDIIKSQLNTILLLRKQLDIIEKKYRDEIYYNICLCDLLKANNISYREVFNHNYRKQVF